MISQSLPLAPGARFLRDISRFLIVLLNKLGGWLPEFVALLGSFENEVFLTYNLPFLIKKICTADWPLPDDAITSWSAPRVRERTTLALDNGFHGG